MNIVKRIVTVTYVAIGLVFITSGALLAHVERTYFLKGLVGKREIAIKMLCYDEMPVRHIHYFFQDDKRDRYLIGKQKEKLWNFQTEEQYRNSYGKSAVSLNIVEHANGIWKGAWVDSAGKSRDLILKPIISDSIASPFNYLPYIMELDPYERCRIADIHFTKSNTEKLTTALVADWYVEPESRIPFFRLRSTASKMKTDSINATLETIHLSLIHKYFSYDPEKTNTKLETKLSYPTNELVSFQIQSTTSFRNGTTSKTRQLITFDIRSGLEVNLEDLIWFDKAEIKPEPGDLYKIYKYRKNIFAPKVFSLLLELHPDKMNTDSCDINKVEAWALPAWSLSSKGIAFSFRTFDRCDVFNWAIIPYDKLKPFMEEKYQLKAQR